MKTAQQKEITTPHSNSKSIQKETPTAYSLCMLMGKRKNAVKSNNHTQTYQINSMKFIA